MTNQNKCYNIEPITLVRKRLLFTCLYVIFMMKGYVKLLETSMEGLNKLTPNFISLSSAQL